MSNVRVFDFEPDRQPEEIAGSPNEPMRFCDIGQWSEQPPPPREWAVQDRFPLRNVGLLSGEGSVGKTILLMQLAVAHVLAKDWLGTLPNPGPAIYLNAEDEEAEIHRRLAAIAAHYGASLLGLEDDLHVLALAGQDAALGYPDRNGLIVPTPLFHKLRKAARDIQPKLIALDTSADIFAGNENNRAEVRGFITLNRALAIDANAAVIIAAHPSLTGISSATGLSGSTAWHNSVRARAYMRSVRSEDGTELDQSLRRLEFMKSNYGPVAEAITLRWQDGVFIPEPKVGSLERLAADAKADAVFLQLLDKLAQQGRNVSDRPTSPTFAPTTFAGEAGGLDKRTMAAAMRRLFASNKIRVETYGRPSRPYAKIVACQ